MTIDEIKAEAAALATAMRAETIDEATRSRFIALRAELFQRGVFDPILVRFDSATVTRATNGEIAEELGKIARAD
jgi:hypothetical protein